MPARNRIKKYIENGFYHIYNRGVEKREIFKDERDYAVFLNLLKTYLSPIIKNEPINERVRRRKSYEDEIKVLSFCLMPNHYHLLIQQKALNSMTGFIQAVCTSYSIYFNKKYERVGPLFQGPYKAALIGSDEYLLHVSRYIHLNPKNLIPKKDSIKDLVGYSYSSYPFYLGKNNIPWVNKEVILDYFSQKKGIPKDIFSYQSFVETEMDDPLFQDIFQD